MTSNFPIGTEPSWDRCVRELWLSGKMTSGSDRRVGEEKKKTIESVLLYEALG